MRRVCVILMVVSLALLVSSAQAAAVYKLTFDHGVMSPGPADYTAVAGEVIPAGVHGVLLSPDSISGNLVASDGPQGGEALNMMRGSMWPNKQGYFFGRDYVPNGDNYGTHTYPPYGCPDQIGVEGPIILNEYTIEAIIKPDYTNTGFGLTEVSVIYDSQRYDGIAGGATLAVNQFTGKLTYQSGAPAGFGSIDSSFGLQAGVWYHIAVVVRTDPSYVNQRTELYINGVLDGTGGYPATWETQGLFKLPGYFTVGTQYWPMAQRNWQGQIDAFSISDVALGPGSFAIPEPASVLALAAGLVGILGAVRRQRS